MKYAFFLFIACVAAVNFSAAQNKDAQQVRPNDARPQEAGIVPWFAEKFHLSAGGFVPLNVTDLRVDNHTGNTGSLINLENDLGFKRYVATFLARLQWRASRRSRFDLSFCQLNRSKESTLKKDISFGDHTYHVNTEVNTFFNSSIYRFSYGYALRVRPKYEFGLLFGLHIVKFDLGMSAHGNNIDAGVHDNLGLTAPLPDFGIWGGYAFGSHWTVNGEFDYLSLKIGDVKGRILGANISIIYKLANALGISAGYTGFDFKLNATGQRLNTYINWGYHGPSLSVSYSFGNK